MQVAVLPPSAALTVIIAVPGDTAVTLPIEFTVVTEVLLLDQVTDLLVALTGWTVAVSWVLNPT